MKMQDLAALVQVREHLQRIVTTSRAEKSLMNLVSEMDKVFLEEVKHLDASKAGESVITLVKVGGSPSAEKLEEIRESIEACKDGDFSIVTDHDIVIERIGYSPSDAIAIKAGQVKVLGREVVAESGQLAMNFTEEATPQENKEIRQALTKIEKAQSQEVLDKIAKAKEHAEITDEGAKAIIKNEEEVSEAQAEEIAKKASEIEVDEETKKKTEEEDEAMIAERLANAKRKLSKTKKKTTKKTTKKAKVFTRADE
jgi:hypothetical protein